jgi:hypothetical protein
VITLVTLATAVSLAAAQVSPQLTPGGPVRVQVDTDGARRWVHGALVSADADAVILVPVGHPGTVRLARGSLTRVEASAGTRTRTVHGVLLGGAIGASVGMAIGIAAGVKDCTGFCPPGVNGGTIAAATVILGGLGAVLGGAMGSASHSERWVDVAGPWAPAPGHRLGIAIMIPLGSP